MLTRAISLATTYLYAFLLIVRILYLFSLQDILKKYRFDLPAGIEHDYSNWEKITTSVSYSLTQTRARVKKLVRIIIGIIKNKNAHSLSQIQDSITQNTNIFALAQVIVHGTPCRPTVQLCSRVALMVSITFFSQMQMIIWTMLACDSSRVRWGRKVLELYWQTPRVGAQTGRNWCY